MGYSLRLAKKTQVGPAHPDRDQQFKYIASLKAQFLADEHPVISIDTKKTELIGNYRREGRSWRKEPLEVEHYFQVMRNVWQFHSESTTLLETLDMSPWGYRTIPPSSRSIV